MSKKYEARGYWLPLKAGSLDFRSNSSADVIVPLAAPEKDVESIEMPKALANSTRNKKGPTFR